MKRLALLFIFIAAIGSLSGQSMKITRGEYKEVPQDVRQYQISELICRRGENYVVQLTKESGTYINGIYIYDHVYYAIVDEDLNLIRKVRVPNMDVKYKFVNGNKLHFICLDDNIFHYYLDLDKMELSEPQVLAESRFIAKSEGKAPKGKDYIFQLRYKCNVLRNFNDMIVAHSPNNKYIVIAPYYCQRDETKYPQYCNSGYCIPGDAYCSNLILFDSDMNKLAEREMIDTFLVRYDQIDSNRSDDVNDGKTYYFRPQRHITMGVSVTDDGLVTAVRSRKQLHKISGSELAVSMLTPDGKYESIELGKIVGDDNFDRPSILRCDGKKMLFYGYYTRPTLYERYYPFKNSYHETHICKVFAIGTYEIDLTTHDVKMVDRKDDGIGYYGEGLIVYTDHWKMDSGWVTEFGDLEYWPKTENHEAYYNIYNHLVSIDNDGKIRDNTHYAKYCHYTNCLMDMPYAPAYFRKNPIVHGNYMFHFPEIIDRFYAIDYQGSIDSIETDFNPYYVCRKSEKQRIPVFLGDTVLIRDKRKRYCWGKIEITD